MSTLTIRAALAVAAGDCHGDRLQRAAAAADLHTRRACGRDSIARSCRSRNRPARPTRNSTRATPSRRRGSRSRRPSRAPNVVIVLIDDVGFGGPSTFGGPIRTPTMDRLAQGGLRFNNFHTTALCSPTRNALKTGRNHHTVNTGSIMESATAFPGNTGQNPEQRGAAGGDAAAQRLQHRRLRQVARNRRLGNQRVGPVRPLAHAPGLRQVLRLHRRRDRPVVSAHLRRRRSRSTRRRWRTTTSPST